MSLRVIVATLVVRIRSFSREKSAMFFTVAFPIILVLVFGTIFTKPEHLNFDLAVQDLDWSDASAELIENLEVDGVFKITRVRTDIDAARYARENKRNLVLVIPKGFDEKLTRRIDDEDEDVSVVMTYVIDPSSTSAPTKLQYLHAAVVEANHEVAGLEPFIKLEEKSILSKTYRFIEFFVPGIIAMAVMTSSLSGALNINAELRQKGIVKKLATTPITRTEWLLSNIFYQLILAIVSTVTILLVSYAVFNVVLEINGWLPVFIILAVFAFVGIGMMLTPVARDAESAAAAGNAFLFPMMFLSGTFFPVEMMPGYLQSFARALPLYYVNEGLRASMIFLDDATSLMCAGVTAAFAAVVFILGALTTRWDEKA